MADTVNLRWREETRVEDVTLRQQLSFGETPSTQPQWTINSRVTARAHSSAGPECNYITHRKTKNRHHHLVGDARLRHRPPRRYVRKDCRGWMHKRRGLVSNQQFSGAKAATDTQE